MQRPPYPPDESILARGLGFKITWTGIFMAGLVLAGQGWALHTGSEHWRTLVFTSLCFSQLAYVLAIRSEHQSLFVLGLWSNRPLLATVVLTVALQIALVYLPILQPIFKTSPLTPLEMTVAIATAIVIVAAVELEKVFLHSREATAQIVKVTTR